MYNKQRKDVVEKMKHRIRGQTGWWHRIVALVLVLCAILSMGTVPVFADPPDKTKPVEHLVVVSNSDWFLNELKGALQREEAHGADGGNLGEYDGKEASDHEFVYFPYDKGSHQTTFNASAVTDAITRLRNRFPNSEVAVAFWMGFDEVDDITTFTHEVLVKKDLDGFLTNTVEYTDWVPDPLPDDPEHVKPVKKRRVDTTDQHQFTWEKKNETHWKKAAERYREAMDDTGLSDKLTDIKVKAYWIGLLPNATWKDKNGSPLSNPRIRDGVETLHSDYISLTTPYKKEKSELFGYWANRWNNALSTAGTVVDIWDAATDSKLYYKDSYHNVGSGYHGSMACGGQVEKPSGIWVDGNPLNPDESDNEKPITAHKGDWEYSAEDAANSVSQGYRFYSYDDASYQTLFHIVLENISKQNTVPVSADAIEQDMYSISTALTAYVSNTLSANAGENQKNHALPNVSGAGNAGALIGYGDEDRGFQSGIFARQSKKATAIAYKALDSSSTKDMLTYARYGRLLNQMGLDEYGVKTTSLSGRTIAGLVMLIVFVLSLVCTQLFGWFIDILIVLNPFRFFLWVPGVGNGLLAGAIAKSDTGLGHVLQVLVNSPPFQTVGRLFSSVYNGLTQWSWTIMIPFSLCMLIVSLFLGSKLFRQNQKSEAPSHKIFTWFLRVAFVAIGVPMLGLIYTSALNQLDGHVGASNSASTEIVNSTFVDFEAWAEELRLSPVKGGTFISESSGTNVVGTPSDETIIQLRNTVLSINKASGAVTTGSASTTDVMDWNREMLDKVDLDTSASNASRAELDLKSISESMKLLMGYTEGDFYYPSDWESAVGSSLHRLAKREGLSTGRRKGGEEQDFKADELQGENTYYNMYDSINEFDDWQARQTDENSEIFTFGKKWSKFNILSNGSSLGSGSSGSIQYSDASGIHDGSNPSIRGGLSTMSMYNYLSSRFSQDGVVTYSNETSVNLGSKYSHYSVNLIGSGIVGGLYYANAMALMMVLAIIGLCYVLGAVMNILKKGISIIGALPAAALGSIRAIGTAISVGLSMTLEVCLIGFLYLIITELLYALVDVVEGAVAAIATGSSVATATISLFGQSVTMPVMALFIGLVGMIVLCIGLCNVLWRYRKAWYYACDKMTTWMLAQLVPVEVFAMQEARSQRKFTSSFGEWVATVQEILYTDSVAERYTCVSCQHV